MSGRVSNVWVFGMGGRSIAALPIDQVKYGIFMADHTREVVCFGIGHVPDEVRLDNNMTVADTLRFYKDTRFTAHRVTRRGTKMAIQTGKELYGLITESNKSIYYVQDFTADTTRSGGHIDYDWPMEIKDKVIQMDNFLENSGGAIYLLKKEIRMFFGIIDDFKNTNAKPIGNVNTNTNSNGHGRGSGDLFSSYATSISSSRVSFNSLRTPSASMSNQRLDPSIIRAAIVQADSNDDGCNLGNNNNIDDNLNRLKNDSYQLINDCKNTFNYFGNIVKKFTIGVILLTCGVFVLLLSKDHSDVSSFMINCIAVGTIFLIIKLMM